MIKKIDHIGVAVQDIEKALSLFRDVLGMELSGSEEVARKTPSRNIQCHVRYRRKRGTSHARPHEALRADGKEKHARHTTHDAEQCKS